MACFSSEFQEQQTRIWEDDGGSWFEKLIYAVGQRFKVPIKDDADEMGGNPIGFDDPNYGSYDTGDASYKMKYQ